MVEVRGDLFLSSKGDDFRFVGVGSEDIAVLSKMSDLDRSQGIEMLTAKDDGDNE
jgi:predicted glycosyltransferase involved in capsule biosynthesis